ncbi:MAG: 23S rRNA (uracil(1939)-C(5))-methyltransferase RlmD [Lachnospiraceae bacterium]|nr:23S rRNA (uracil(1939)-C(5))-methyltransferase RlmD [Lachnospiraceae bacterium]
MIEKNHDYELTIEDYGNDGEGIGRIGDFVVFVKDAAKGDRAIVRITKVKKSYAYGRLMELMTPSPDRAEPSCPHAKVCGGCSLMHISYEKQLEWKQNKVEQALLRIGGIANIKELMEPIVACDGKGLHYRNKAQFPVGCDKDGDITIGFYAGRSHRIIDTDSCLLQPAHFDEIIGACRVFFETHHIKPYDEEKGSGLVRHIVIREGRNTGQIMVTFVLNGDGFGRRVAGKDQTDGPLFSEEQALIDHLRSVKGIRSIIINTNKEKTNRILGFQNRVLWGSDVIEDTIGDVRFAIGPMSFYQVNPSQTKRMYEKALAYANLTGGETVWDLYCGIGTISLFLAKKAGKVYGVEIVEEAIEDAKRNAALNNIQNAEFYVGKSEEILPEKHQNEGVSADVIVVDPPRKGCDAKLLETILSIAPKRVVYVSCDPATLARDVRILTEGGYELQKACAFDNFGQTGHVETVVSLRRSLEKG